MSKLIGKLLNLISCMKHANKRSRNEIRITLVHHFLMFEEQRKRTGIITNATVNSNNCQGRQQKSQALPYDPKINLHNLFHDD